MHPLENKMTNYDLIVVGAGAAGMMAACAAAKNGMDGRRILILEQNEKPGKKIYITGKGRCNFTNACELEELFLNIPQHAKFLYSSFYTFSNQDVIDFFESAGMKTKVERGNRVFPASDHASDVTGALKRMLDRYQVEIRLHSKVEEISCCEDAGFRLVLQNEKILYAKKLLLATGGKSYPATGSTGDGYRFAGQLGHTVTDLSPSLVPFSVKEEFVKDLQGLALKNIKVQILDGKKVLFEEFGELLFTHFGVSGPVILKASAVVNKQIQKKNLELVIDWKPALDEGQLDKRILRDFEDNQNRQFKNAIDHLVPAKMLPVLIRLCGIPEDKKVNEITREERKKITLLLKHFSVTLTALRGFNEAIITRGGIALKEVNPSTMESKLVSGLFFAGEVLDLDGFTGGFNLQIAWSTGYLAGLNIAEQMEEESNGI